MGTRRKLIVEIIIKTRSFLRSKIFFIICSVTSLAWGIFGSLLCLDSQTVDNMCMLYCMYAYFFKIKGNDLPCLILYVYILLNT